MELLIIATYAFGMLSTSILLFYKNAQEPEIEIDFSDHFLFCSLWPLMFILFILSRVFGERK